MEILHWMRSSDVVALGWTLLHFCWQGVAVALLYAVVDRAANRMGAAARYGIAVMALTLMPLIVAATFIEQERLVVHMDSGAQQVVVSQLGTLHRTFVERASIVAPTVETSEVWIAENAASLLPWLDGIWLAGVLLLALRAFGGWWHLEKLRQRAKAAVPEEVAASFDKLAEHLKVGRHVALRVSNEVISPMAMGVWRTAIILPLSAVMSLDTEQMEAVLAHELAHVRRWDYLCNLLQTAVECLLFFHPAVWWMSRRMRDLREICCDEVAARNCDDPVIYAEALLQLEEQKSRRLRLAMAARGHRGMLAVRVRQILGEGMTMENKSMNGTRIVVASAVLLAAFVGPRVASGLKAHDTAKIGKSADQTAAIEAEVRTEVAPITTAQSVLAEPAAPRPTTAPQQEAHLLAPQPVVAVLPMAAPAPIAAPAPLASPEGQEGGVRGNGMEYIQKMKDAGYPLSLDKDLDTIVSLRSVGVTPEYARQMAQVGLGTPALHDLIALRSVGVTPEYLQQLKSSGIAPASFHDAISEKSVGVTPEYAKSIASMNLGNATAHDLVSLKAQGVTPEYVTELRSAGIDVTDLHTVGSMKAVGVTPEFAKSMSATGFGKLSSHDLISLRAQGVTPEYMQWLKKTFPDADVHAIHQAAALGVNADFVAKAQSHGFNTVSPDKLTKLKISGLLD